MVRRHSPGHFFALYGSPIKTQYLSKELVINELHREVLHK